MTTVFIPQLDTLAEALRNASSDAGGESQGGSPQGGQRPSEGVPSGESAPAGFAFARPPTADGVATLSDRAMNVVELDGAPVAFTFPEPGGRARDFLLKLRAAAATDVSFPDGIVWESDDPDVFDTPEDGETIVLFFSETEPGVFMVARKTVQTVES